MKTLGFRLAEKLSPRRHGVTENHFSCFPLWLRVSGGGKNFQPTLRLTRPSGPMDGASHFCCASRFFKERFAALCFRAHPALSFRAERKSWGSPKHKASIDRRSVEAGEPQLWQIYSLRDGDGIPWAWSRSRVMGSTRGTVGKRECCGIPTLCKNRKGWPPSFRLRPGLECQGRETAVLLSS